MRPFLSEKEILDFLLKIERKEIILKAIIDPNKVYAGNVVYQASNGWELTIFNDSNSWDYIDSIKISENVIIDFDELDKMQKVRNYIPPIVVIKKIYNIPENE